ncbi:MAG TPA: KTSC domain-containing protein [Devosiaceae bacterium]|nr:KTSC domain-containing protein [Devosiaceae bacterium]
MPSTAILRIRYDAESRTLSVWFVPSGCGYGYLDVPPEIVAAFKAPGSKGRFFNARIRDRFPCRPVAEAGSQDPFLRP